MKKLEWSLVQAFLSVAETGSLSAAARQMGASQPTLGRQIKQMESDLGLELFARQPRGLDLTDVGKSMLGPAIEMRKAMNEIALTAAGKQDTLEGSVRITASEIVAHYILPSIVADIQRQEPLVSIDLVPTDTSENLLFREADIAVRMYRSEQLDVITTYIGDLEMGLFAAKPYLDRVGRPRSVADLKTHQLVGFDSGEQIIRGMRHAGWDVSRETFKTRTDSQTLYWELVRAGCGVGFAQVSIGQSEPGVEQIDVGFAIPALPVWLATHQGMRQTPRIRKVWEMLGEGLKPFVYGGVS